MSVPPTLSVPALTVTVALLACQRRRAAEDHAAVVAGSVADIDRCGRNRHRRQGQGRAVGGLDVLDAAGVPERTRVGKLPVPAASETVALAEATTSPPTCTLPPLTTFCTVTLPARLSPPTALAGPQPPKSSVEPAGARCWYWQNWRFPM